jgi:hypothetical protein
MIMRFTNTLLTVVVLSVFALAEDAKKDSKIDVKEIDLSGIKFDRPKGRADKPTAITSADELAKTVTIEEARKRIAKDVDFATQQVIWFAWSGSGGDKISSMVADGDNGPEVVFQFERGLTRDLRGHIGAFVIPAKVAWRVERKKKP